ncbi:hypothetical protein GHT06_015435 [Daphnia sinensis]|uniref:GH16 domain-containing protein n=1 Tax=Daphnia sinensis TaxID=1820382 RepID=A0AAD5PSX7_9CRUS|nr:hypothetical protein GHT06_015435 [Daphnia sinensis]
MRTFQLGRFIIVFFLSQCIARGVVTRINGELIFDEEFNTLDSNRWHHVITGWRGGNGEFQYYTNRTENSYVKDGILFIKPTLTAHRFSNDFLYTGTLDLNNEGCNIDWNGGCVIQSGEEIINPIQSARIVTSKSFSFTYGTVEVRAKMPKGDWIWPAIWMLPTEGAYGGWPHSGEIDIVEIRGNTDFRCNGVQLGNTVMTSALHWGQAPSASRIHKNVWEKSLSSGSYSSDFHVYRLEWFPTGITFKMDGETVGSLSPPAGGFWELSGLTGANPWSGCTRMAPFDQKFHLVLNVAVGAAGFFPEGCVNVPYNKPWTASSSTPMTSRDDSAMQVDYIRVWSP